MNMAREAVEVPVESREQRSAVGKAREQQRTSIFVPQSITKMEKIREMGPLVGLAVQWKSSVSKRTSGSRGRRR